MRALFLSAGLRFNHFPSFSKTHKWELARWNNVEERNVFFIVLAVGKERSNGI
jgi:hypothetical protein